MNSRTGDSRRKPGPASAAIDFLAAPDDLTDEEVESSLAEGGIDVTRFQKQIDDEIRSLIGRRRLTQAREAVEAQSPAIQSRGPRGLSREQLVEKIKGLAELMNSRQNPTPAFSYREFDESSVEQLESILDELEEAAEETGIGTDEQ